MPPQVRITKEKILETALQLVRQEGEEALNARRIARELHCSTQPIFTNFATMDELRREVKKAANNLYQNYLMTDMAAGRYPPYKASGMAYIRFAREERELFKLLFMCDRSRETIVDERESIRPLLTLIRNNLGVSEEEAVLIHMEMWIFAHGIATMLATAYLNWDEALISTILTDAYHGIQYRYTEGKHHDSDPM